MKRSFSLLSVLLALAGPSLAQAQSCASGGGATVCLTATGSNSSISLNWTVSGSINKVQIYRDTDSDPNGRARIAQLSSSGARSYVDTAATTGTHYWYWVKFSAGGGTYDSNPADATRVVVTSQGGGGTPALPGTMRTLSSLQLLPSLAPGWNLGNSLEAMGGETNWGNPAATPSIFNAVKAAGFNSVRIPVSWKQYADSNDNIRPDWMARVTEVVNAAHNAGLYAIINIHWDGGWMNQPTYAQQPSINARIRKFWTQIATNFRNYDDMLLFAGTNEVQMANDYSAPSVEYATVQNGFNQAFVDAVRATGGNNAARHLIVQGFNTNIDFTCTYFTVPVDSAASRLAVEVHDYDPYNFTLNTSTDAIWQWGSIATDPSATETWANEAYVDGQFDRLRQQFIVGLGMPVLVGEYGAISRLAPDGAQQYRSYWDRYITAAARSKGLVPVYWDDGYNANHTMGLFNRWSSTQAFPALVSTIVNAH